MAMCVEQPSPLWHDRSSSHDTSLDHELQSFEILFKSNETTGRYDPDKANAEDRRKQWFQYPP